MIPISKKEIKQALQDIPRLPHDDGDHVLPDYDAMTELVYTWLETRLRQMQRLSHEVEQILGKALGYPWYKDDKKNFPDATEADGVCVGDHVPESIAEEASNRIKSLKTRLQQEHALNKQLQNILEEIVDTATDITVMAKNGMTAIHTCTTGNILEGIRWALDVTKILPAPTNPESSPHSEK